MRVNCTERIRVYVGLTVIPPFEILWLSDADLKLSDERGCIVFDVCGENDATVILASKPGSRRRQQFGHTEAYTAEDGYTVIFGSHRNSVLSIERNGEKQPSLCEEWTTISPNSFTRFWICFICGQMYVGRGDPSERYQYKYTDPNPLSGIQFVGLSAWDKHCTFRNVRVEPTVPWLAIDHEVPSLANISLRSLLDHLNIESACQALLVLDSMELPNLEKLRKKAVTLLAQEFTTVVNECRQVFCQLSGHALSSLLKSPDLVIPLF